MPARGETEDLFPRGHARGQPAVRFAANADAPEKGEKRERQPEHAPRGRLTPGSTVLAIVTRCDERALHFALPSGTRARADPHETLSAGDEHRLVDAVAAAAGDNELDAPDAGDAPLFKVLRKGQVVRAAVVAGPANAGTNHVQLSLQPALVNAGLQAAQLLVKGTPVYAAVKSVEDHGYVLDFGAVQTKGFLPFEDAADIGGDASAENEDDAESQASGEGSASSSDEGSDVADSNTLLPGTPVEVVVSQTIRAPDAAEGPVDGERKKKKKRKKSKRGVVSTVRVSAKNDFVRKAETLMVDGLNFHGLRAGMRVNAKVLSIHASKVLLTVFGLFSLSVDILHVPHGPDGTPSVKVGSSVFARLLSVDAGQKSLSASLLPDVVKDFHVRAVPEDWTIGTIVKGLVVDRVDPTFGLFLRQVREGEQAMIDEHDGEVERSASESVEFGVPLFAHISRIAEKRPDRLEKNFYKGFVLEQNARIVSISQFDGIVNVDLRPSILNRAALDISEVQAGRFYNCKVISHLSSGALSVAVDGDIHIRGIIPRQQIADTAMSSKALAKHPNLRTGGTVKCVALSVNPKRQMIYLSARRSLVSSTDPVLRSYDEAEQALKKYRAAIEAEGSSRNSASASEPAKPPVFVGTVDKIMEKFMVVSFCGWTSGTLDFKKLCLDQKAETPSKKRKRKGSAHVSGTVQRTKEDVEALYPAGQTVRVCVVKVDPRRRKLCLSMDLTGSEIISATITKAGRDPEIALGTVTDAVIRSCDEEQKRFTVSVRVEVQSDVKEPDEKSKRLKKSSESSSSLQKTGDAKYKQIECFVPFGHMADSLSVANKISQAYVKTLKSGAEDSQTQPLKLCDAMVLRHDAGLPILTRKQSLIAAFREGQLPRTFAELEALCFKTYGAEEDECNSALKPEVDEGARAAILQSIVLNGYVKGVLPTGVFIGFLGGLTGFAKKSRIADFFVGDLKRALALHSSIAVSMESLDKDSQRFNVSLRPSDVGGKRMAVYAKSLVADLEYARFTFGKEISEKEFAIGSIVNGNIEASRPYGIVLKLKSALGTKAVGVALNSASSNENTPTKLRALPASMKDPLAQVGEASVASAADDKSVISALAETAADNAAQATTPAARTRSARKKVMHEEEKVPSTKVRVLDVDPFSGVVDVSQDVRWISSVSKRPSLSGSSAFQATVLLVKDDYIILAVQKTKMKTVIAHSLLPVVVGGASLKPGVEVSCRALAVDIAKSGRIFVTIDWDSVLKTAVNNAKQARSVERESKPVKKSAVRVDDNFTVGALVHGPVTKVLPYQVHVKIGRTSSGRIHITNRNRLSRSEVSSFSLGPLTAGVAKRFSLPKLKHVTSDVKIIDITDAKKQRKGVDGASKIVVAELAAEGAKELPFTSKYVPAPGDRVVGFLKSKSMIKSRFQLAITPKIVGVCHQIDAISNSDSPSFIFENSSEWSPCLCLVQSVTTEEESGKEVCNVRLSVSPNGAVPDAFFYGIIQKVKPGYGLRVGVPWNARPEGHKNCVFGFLGICDVDSNFDEAVKKMSSFKVGNFIQVRIARVDNERREGKDQETSSMSLTMRLADADTTVKDVLITEISEEQVKNGAPVRGFVNNVNKFGAFLWIGRKVQARVQLCDLSDDFVKEPEKAFPIGTLVQGKISEVKDAGTAGATVAVTLRKKPQQTKDAVSTVEVAEGEVVDGTVTRVERFGAIVKLAKGNSALLHTSEADQDRQVKDPWKEWTVGQRITAVVIDASIKKRRVGTKRCHFEAASVENEKIDAILENNAQKEVGEPSSKRQKLAPLLTNSDDDNEVLEAMKMVAEGRAEDSDAGAEDDEEDADNGESSSENSEFEEEQVEPKGPVLNIAHAFSLEEEDEAEPLAAISDDDVSDAEVAAGGKREDGTNGRGEDDAPRKTKTSKEKREKKRAKEAAEREIQAKEETLAANPDTPETAEDFERMILGEPNSSAIWIRYMAFRLSLAQIDKARAVAERALETIELTKELERVNLWMAYVNLEANFGGSPGGSSTSSALTKAAAVFRVFDRASKRVTDVQDFYLQVFTSLRDSEPGIAEEVMKRAIRQFKHAKEVWIAAGSAKFEKGDADGGRKILERALVSLEKRDHVAVIMKFSQLEYRHGSVERGRTVFESLIGNYPKRLDVWSVFLDMESGICRDAEEGSEKKEAVESTRLIFERCASLELSSKKMKSVFKKWLTFEKRFGDKASHKAVLAKAKQYVENKSLAADAQQKE